PVAEQSKQAVRGQPAVAAERDRGLAGALEHRRVRASQVGDEIVVEVAFDDAADIVLAKDLRIHRCCLPPRRAPPTGPPPASLLPQFVELDLIVQAAALTAARHTAALPAG